MSQAKKKVILSGMRPTGHLHLGHWVGAMSNWIKLQKEYNCFFMVADWHALMSEYRSSSSIKDFSFDNVCDWLACGIDPEKSVIFTQSKVSQHLELFMILSVLTPLGWLSRCPTFKEQIKQLKDKEINTYAFLGYPALQSADIILYNADRVPVGEDQLPHLELCREIIRRFHHIYKKKIFTEPKPLLTSTPRFFGLDGRKMSKSYNNYIGLSEEDKDIDSKVLSMFTDPARKLKNDPGHPDVCNVFDYYSIFAPERKAKVCDWCINAKKGCRDCKTELADIIKSFIAPLRDKKKNLLGKKDYVYGVLEEGTKKAKVVAEQTMDNVKKVLQL